MPPFRTEKKRVLRDPIKCKDAVGIATQEYATRVQMLIQLMTELRSIGAQADVDLPRIAVIGNQSAGKSSLVEAISGISVPRAAGTCTRCPMECRLSYSEEPWKAQVLIRIEIDPMGNALSDVKEVPFCDVLTNKKALEECIKRAQTAVLNPTVPLGYFLNHVNPPPNTPKQLQFSSNVVCIDISGPEVTDLSFIDLPGIISNVADDEERGNIELVKSLVKKHIAGNALILLTLTMRDDLENQSAAFLAKEVDPEGLRTIGVLTKPDTLQEGEHASWLDVLEKKKHVLRHGYFVTRQPATSELALGLDHEAARQKEKEFFTTQAPWTNLSATLRGRMGVPNLTKELSRLLSQLIEDLLPKLRNDSYTAFVETTDALRNLPEPVSQYPLAQLLDLITSFSNQVNAYVLGNEKHGELLQQCNSAYLDYRDSVKATRPLFVPASSTDTGFIPEPVSAARVNGKSTKFPMTAPKPMYLDDVREHLKKSLTRQLPFNTPFSAKVDLIETNFEKWGLISEHCFRGIFKVMKELLLRIAQTRFGRFSRGGLLARAGMAIDKLLKEAEKETLERITWLMEIEKPPFTLNEHYYSELRERFLGELKSRRPGAVLPSNRNGSKGDAPNPSDAIAELAKLGIVGLTATDLEKLRKSDPYEQELICMAEVCAYFKVAYKRIIDTLPRAIDHSFLRRIGRSMQDSLFTELGLSDEDASHRAASYLAEDPAIVMQRVELEQKKVRLESVIDKLYNFNSEY